MGFPEDFIKAMDKAGVKSTTTRVSKKTLKKWAKLSKETEKFFKRVAEELLSLLG